MIEDGGLVLLRAQTKRGAGRGRGRGEAARVEKEGSSMT